MGPEEQAARANSLTGHVGPEEQAARANSLTGHVGPEEQAARANSLTGLVGPEEQAARANKQQQEHHTFSPRLFSSFFGEQGFDKVGKSSRTIKLFEGFDVQL